MSLFTFIINAIDSDTKRKLRQIEKKLDILIAENESARQEILDKLEESIDQVESIV
jgi:predicted DNA-binding protein YlxM (UPF0122 family)